MNSSSTFSDDISIFMSSTFFNIRGPSFSNYVKIVVVKSSNLVVHSVKLSGNEDARRPIPKVGPKKGACASLRDASNNISTICVSRDHRIDDGKALGSDGEELFPVVEKSQNNMDLPSKLVPTNLVVHTGDAGECISDFVYETGNSYLSSFKIGYRVSVNDVKLLVQGLLQSEFGTCFSQNLINLNDFMCDTGDGYDEGAFTSNTFDLFKTLSKHLKVMDAESRNILQAKLETCFKHNLNNVICNTWFGMDIYRVTGGECACIDVALARESLRFIAASNPDKDGRATMPGCSIIALAVIRDTSYSAFSSKFEFVVKMSFHLFKLILDVTFWSSVADRATLAKSSEKHDESKTAKDSRMQCSMAASEKHDRVKEASSGDLCVFAHPPHDSFVLDEEAYYHQLDDGSGGDGFWLMCSILQILV